MATVTEPITADDLMRLPDNGDRLELVRGEVVRMPPPGAFHGTFGSNLLEMLAPFVRSRRLGICNSEAGFLLSRDPDTVRSPDAAFISRARVESIGGIPAGYWPWAPDLAVEILSPTDVISDAEAKAQEYLDAGSSLVWLVNPRRRQVKAFRPQQPSVILNENDELDGGEILPGFRRLVSEIFLGL